MNRREALTLFAGAAGATLALAQDNGKGPGPGKGKGPRPELPPPTGPVLPLKTTGLEHIGVTVPNPEASAKLWANL